MLRPGAALLSAFLLAPALAACSSSDAPNPVAAATPVGPLGNVAGLPVDDYLQIANLSAPVDVVRDRYGRPHIYAANATDALRVEGYLIVRDRAFQLEFFRRLSEGRLAEILAQSDRSLIDLDITFRHIGLARVAKAQYDALPEGDLKQDLDAYSDGITQAYRLLRSETLRLPEGILEIDPSAFTDWTGVDSLAIGRLETYLLSYDADTDITETLFYQAARTTFPATDPDPAIRARTGIERDLIRFAPADPATTTTGYPMTSHHAPLGPTRRGGSARPQPALLRSAVDGYLRAMQHSRRLLNPKGFGSNDMGIMPSRSATGHSLIESDPHLPLNAPSILWPVSIDVTAANPLQNLKVAGGSFPGIPGIILGHNANIAWGATVAGYDVSDAYQETLTPDGSGVTFNGKTVPLQTIDEVINIQGSAPYTYHVLVVPQHGPIVPNIVEHAVVPPTPQTGAISVKWTGFQPTNELEAVFGLLYATNVDEARTALNDFGVGAQNWMLGDTSGNILWTTHALVPTRDRRSFQWNAATYTGELPCLVLPGDGSAEWTGFLPDNLVPWEKNPAAGFLSTANNDPIGVTLDNDPSNKTLPDGTPMYLGCTFDIGFREGRIHSLIKGQKTPLALTDLAAVEADEHSAMGSNLVASLLEAITAAQAEKKTPGTHPDLTAIVTDPAYSPTLVALAQSLLTTWSAQGNYAAEPGIDLDTNQPLPASGASAAAVQASQATLIFNAWMVRLMALTFGDENGKMNQTFDHDSEAKALLHLVQADPTTLATYDPTTGDSAIWDDLGTPNVVETRHERMVHALVDAFTDLGTLAGADPSTYRWGALHTLTLSSIISAYGSLAIPPAGDPTFPNGFPRKGDSFSIDACEFDFVDLASPLDFTYEPGNAFGPAQRFVSDLNPAGPVVFNAFPGGNVWDAASPHFQDEAAYWRENKNHAVPFLLADVIAAKESRTVVSSP